MNVSLASGNPNKLRELRECLPGWELEALDADSPLEESDSYYENARAKARFGRMIGEFDVWVLGEDSGLEVSGLGGRPGVRSARFAAPGEDPVAKLLEELEGVSGEGRSARYVSELVLLSPELEEFRGSGILTGIIATEARGTEGFGYDPIFVPEGESRTVAELGDEWKSEHSHRARAAKALRDSIAAEPL